MEDERLHSETNQEAQQVNLFEMC